MRPSNVIKALITAIKADVAVFLWGEPATAKTALVRLVAKQLEMKCHTLILSQLDPVDLRGLPTTNGSGKTHWAIPAFFPEEGPAILFLDELSTAPQAMQAVAYQLILERRIGEHFLPEGVIPIAAGNRMEDRAIAIRQSSALASRFVHVDVDEDHKDWLAWALTAGIRHEVCSYIRWQPQDLHNFDPNINPRSFPCYRTWEMVSKIMEQSPPVEIEFDMYSGSVGEPTATKFLAFLRVYRDMVDPREIIANPEKAPVPAEDRPDLLYATTGALVHLCNDQSFPAIVKYAVRLPAEHCVSLVLDCIRREPLLQKTKPYQQWAMKYKDIIVS